MDRNGDYGYDAPYALKAFAALGAASVVAAIVARWRQNGHLAAMLGFYGAFFLANAASFFYTTRRGKFQVWEEVLDGLHLSRQRARARHGVWARCRPDGRRDEVEGRTSDRHRSLEHARSIRECPRGDDAKRVARRCQ